MEYTGITSIKNTYRDILQEQGEYEKAAALNRKDFKDPVFDGYSVHPEDEPSVADMNNALQQIGIDLIALDSQFTSAAELYQDLMDDILMNLDAVDEIIEIEKERIQDINMIAGNLSEFTTIKTLRVNDFSGTASAFDDLTFTTNATTRESVVLEVDAVSGNGYEGNAYVYNNNTFEKDSMDTSNRNFLVDNVSSSYYEYSRITMTNKQQHYPPEVNFDSKEAECTITVYSDTVFNTLRIQSDINSLEVVQISTSTDGGITYNESMSKSVQINNSENKYDDSDYIYGSGVLCFPRTQYAKIRLRSSGALEDKLAFKKILLEEANLLINVTFSIDAYVKEYLAPLFTRGLIAKKDIKAPVSVFLAVTLIRTENKPFNVGHFNFWNLPYIENISTETSDKGNSSFESGEDGINGILNYVSTDTAMTKALSVYVLPEEETTTTASATQYTERTDPNTYRYTMQLENSSYVYFYDENIGMNYRYVSGAKWYFVFDTTTGQEYWYNPATNLWTYTYMDNQSVAHTVYYLDSDILNERIYYDTDKKLFFEQDGEGNTIYFDYNKLTGQKIYHLNDKLYTYDTDLQITDYYDSTTKLCYSGELSSKNFYHVIKSVQKAEVKDQVELFKSFVARLTKGESVIKKNKDNAVLNGAIKTISKFNNWTQLINTLKSDYAAYGNDKQRFLADCCGIKLGNADIGSLVGKDVDSTLPVKTMFNTILEKGSWQYPSSTKFEIRGVIMTVPPRDNLTQLQQFIIGALYTWWLRAAITIAEEEMGILLSSERSTTRTIRLEFLDNVSDNRLVQCVADPEYGLFEGYKTKDKYDVAALVLYINVAQITHVFDLHNPKLWFSAGPLDLMVANELLTGILSANIMCFSSYDDRVINGLSTVALGTVDTFFMDFVNSVQTIDTLLSNSHTAGYMIIKYLLTQASRDRVPTNAPTKPQDTVTRTLYYYDPEAEKFYSMGKDTTKVYTQETYGSARGIAITFWDDNRLKKKAITNVLNVLGANETQISQAIENVTTYSLDTYDDLKTKTGDEDKYNSYFMRKDQWEASYNDSIDDATQIVELETARRHVIRVNNLIGFSNDYSWSSYAKTEELLQGNVSCIAIFANEYIPPTFPTDLTTYNNESYISYVLTVNGTDYDIVPVNSHRAGIKIIRYSNYSIIDNYTARIHEPIKSAYLTIKITTPDISYSPYVSNVKVCIGKAVTK